MLPKAAAAHHPSAHAKQRVTHVPRAHTRASGATAVSLLTPHTYTQLDEGRCSTPPSSSPPPHPLQLQTPGGPTRRPTTACMQRCLSPLSAALAARLPYRSPSSVLGGALSYLPTLVLRALTTSDR